MSDRARMKPGEVYVWQNKWLWVVLSAGEAETFVLEIRGDDGDELRIIPRWDHYNVRRVV